MIYNVYFTVFAIGALVGCFAKPNNTSIRHLLFFMFFVMLIFQDGFRWEIGTDWNPYYEYFEKCNTVQSESDDFEIGYVYFNKIMNDLTGNYTVFLVLHALLLYSTIFSFIKKYSLYPLLSLLLYYAFMNANMGMNRQFLALIFALISIKFILQRRFVYFLICIYLGFLFHSSILLFAPAYFLCKELNIRIIIGLLLFGVGIAVSGIINTLPFELLFVINDRMSSKLEIYTSGGTANLSMINTILSLTARLFWLILLLLVRNRFGCDVDSRDKFNLCFNLYLVSVVIYMAFNGSVLQIIVSRGLIYYSIFAVIAIPYVYASFKGAVNKFIVFCVILLYAWVMFTKNMNAHTEVGGSDIFNPYVNVLF